MAEPPIIQQIKLEGGDAFVSDLNKVGAAGEQAFNKVADSTNKTSAALGAVGKAFKQFSDGFKRGRDQAINASEGIDKVAEASGKLGKNLLPAGQVRQSSQAIVELASSFSAVGLAVKGVIAAIGVSTGLNILAKLGTSAAQAFADLAAASKLTGDELGKFQAIGLGAGVALDGMGKTIKAVSDLVKSTDANVIKNTDTFKRLGDQLRDTRDKGDELQKGFDKLKRGAEDAFRTFSEAQRKIALDTRDASRDFDKSLRTIEERRNDIFNPPTQETQLKRQLRDLAEEEQKLRDDAARAAQERLTALTNAEREYGNKLREEKDAREKLNKSIEDNDRKEREAIDAMSRAQAEAIKNATALEKLGVAALDTSGKLKKSPEALYDIANALKAVKDPTERAKIEFDLIAAGIDRKLLPALRGGAAALKELEAANKAIKPPFTDAEVKVADNYSTALGKASGAFENLYQRAGLQVAIAITPQLEALQKIISDITPTVVEFAKRFAELAVSVIENFGKGVVAIVVPAFNLLRSVASGLAGLINTVFGTNLKTVQIFGAAIIALAAFFFPVATAVGLVVTAIGYLSDKFKTDDFKPYVDFAKSAFDTIVSIVTTTFQVLVGVITPFKDALVFLFDLVVVGATAAFTGIGVIATAALTIITTAWGALSTFFTNLFTVIGAAGGAVWTKIKEGATAGLALITAAWTTFGTFLTGLWDGLTTGAAKLWTWVSDQAKICVDYLTGLWTAFTDTLKNLFTSVGDTILAVWNSVKDIVSKLASAVTGGGAGSSGGASEAPAFAGGGRVRGPGSGTSDSIWARLSNGEFVARAAAVKKYGVDFFHSINSLRFQMPGFAQGGLLNALPASRPKIRFADGGLVKAPASSRGTVNLTIGDQNFAMEAEGETLARLQSLASSRRVSAAGKKPTWYGGR